MALQIRRGNTASRVTITPASGELLFDTDIKAVYVGDGTVAGGIPVGGGGGGNSGVNQIIAGNNITVSPISGNGNVTVAVVASGSNTQIQLNDDGNLGTSSNLTFNKNSNTLGIGGLLRIRNNTTTTPVIVTGSGNVDNVNFFTTQFSRGTVESPLPAQEGDRILALDSRAYTSSNVYQDGGGFVVEVDSGAAANASTTVPSRVTIYSTDGNNNTQFLTLDSQGNLSVPGRVTSLVYSNSNVAGAYVTGRARGANVATILPVAVGDSIFRNVGLGYTGNGTDTLNGVPGWAVSSVIESRVTALPTGNANVPTNIIMRTYSSNAQNNRMVFGDTGDLSIFGETGNIYGNNIVATGNVESVNVTLTGLLQSPPATKAATDPGTVGQICWDADYIYVCTATNVWKRVQLTTF